MRLLLASALLAAAAVVPASSDATPGVTPRRPSVQVTGVLDGADPMGCDSRLTTGCDEHPFTVTAPAGAWVTVSIPGGADDPTIVLRVRTAAGEVVGETGYYVYPHDTDPGSPGRLTFRQVRAGRVEYLFNVSSADPLYAAAPWEYTVTIALGGNGWDREMPCSQVEPEVVPPIPADTSKRLPLSVLVLTTRDLLPEVRKTSQVIVEDYAKINIAVRLTVRAADLPATGDPQVTFAYLRSLFGGERPRGTDLVYAASDYFPGGVADCIGGVRFAERAFALGQVHYTAQGAPVPGNQVRMGHIAAHELGHLLGGQHQFSNCAEGEPEAALASDPGPCTVMSPAALTGNGEWSTVETAYVRYYVERYAKG